MRVCSRCRKELPTEDFPLRRKDGAARYSHCRECKAAYQRQWYLRNAERHRANAARLRLEIRRRNKEIVRRAKDVPCQDCGRRYPAHVMDFDHVRGRKLGNVSLMKNYAGTVKLVAEIAKCDVVCANCHRIRSHRRRAASKR
jgi:hypothetical protein